MFKVEINQGLHQYLLKTPVQSYHHYQYSSQAVSVFLELIVSMDMCQLLL